MTVSITLDTVAEALGQFLQPFVGDAKIVRSQVNRVPMPGDPCVILTELLTVDLETATTTFGGFEDTSSPVSIATPQRTDWQIDFYGPDSGDQCTAVKMVYRTTYATDAFPDNIKPLYCSDGVQGPLITAEQQWESRWTLTASLQYNPVVSLPQQSATALSVNVLEDLQ